MHGVPSSWNVLVIAWRWCSLSSTTTKRGAEKIKSFPLSEHQGEHCAIESIRNIGILRVREHEASAIQFHHHVGVVEANAHAIGPTAEEGASQPFRIILKSRAVVGNDDRGTAREIHLDVDVQLSPRCASPFGPSHLQPIERVVQQIVQRPKEKSERKASFDVRGIVFQGRTDKFDLVAAEPHD